MRVGIIRGDLPGPLFMADLEPTSQTNFPTEPEGQTSYVSRPDLTVVEEALADAPAVIRGNANITFARVIDGTNDTLLLNTDGTGSFTTVTIAHASYANRTTLLAAINAALVVAGLGITAIAGTTSVRISFQSTATGVGTTIRLSTTGGGSTANTALGLPNGLTWLVPSAASAIASFLPVGGPLDVSSATILAAVSPVLDADQVEAIADSIAPRFVDTDVAVKSFQVGNLSQLLSASYNPDVNRLPPISEGAAITVVTDDGSTLFTATLPTISGAVHDVPNTGDITITGTGLGNAEWDATRVKVWDITTGALYVIDQKFIETTVSGGTTGEVSATTIVIPASLLHDLGVADSLVQVQYTSLVSNRFTVT